MANIEHLLAQKAALEKQIDAAQKEARSEAIDRIKSLMSAHGLTTADLGQRKAARKTTRGAKVAVKYRNTATGDSWSGRGLQPKWLKAALASGRKLSEFAV